MTERKTKRVADLTVGDLVLLNDPDGVGRILSKGPSRLFKAEGGCFRLDVRVTDGPHRGKTIKDQHFPGDMLIEVPS